MGPYELEDGTGSILLQDLSDYYEITGVPTPPSGGATWWNGSSRQSNTLRGWWDGSLEQPVTLLGWRNVSGIDPLL